MSKKKIKPEYKPQFKHTGTENLLKIGGDPVEVKLGDTVEILIYSEKGFSVFIPYTEVFNARVFEAEEEPKWATATDRKMAKAAAEERSEVPKKKGAKATIKKFWGVRMDRIAKTDKAPFKKMPYCIYSKQDNTFAVGNSPPTMVVRP
jgi:hypothetical protein